MKNVFVGRKKELEHLNALLKRKTASLVVIKGRRRIGKSRLIAEFARESKNFFCFTGIAPTKGVTAIQQKEEFARQVKSQFGLPAIKTEDWGDLFTTLASLVKDKETTILFDEISWMAHKDPTFLGKLKIAWDTLFSQNPKLILILCGSVSSWIEKNIISSTGFLGRVTLQMNLPELSLKESIELLNKIGFHGSIMENLMILAITGGIPRYIELIQPNKSAENNIKRLCFEPDGILVNEFNHIFNDLFGKAANIYEKIILSLVKGPLEYKEVSEAINYSTGGPLSEYLDNLIMCGFISRDFSWSIQAGTESKLSKYRLADNYLRFYLKYIKPNLNKIKNNQFKDVALSSFPGWESIMGFQFESIILNNRKLIWEKLGLSPEEIVSDNPYFQRRTKNHKGCQIDYLIQTKYNTLFACEVKFLRKEVSVSIVEVMKNKLQNMVLPKRFSCFPVLIEVNGVSPELEETEYFANIIDFNDVINSKLT